MERKTNFDPKGKKFLAITAHPDDADFACGGTMLKWKNLGVRGSIAIATTGDKGSHEIGISAKELREIRSKEQLAASELLGLENTWFLGYPDSHLENSQELKEEIVRIIRSYKPDIIFTWDPSFPYSLRKNILNHPDHRAVGQAVLDACFPMARDRLTFEYQTKNGLDPHCVTDIFLFNPDKSNYFENISEFIEQKITLLKCHKSQINDQTIENTIVSWATQTGEGVGVKLAEEFVYLNLKKD